MAKELLNDYQKGYIHCLCRAVSLGIRKVTDDIDELCFEVSASEKEFKAAIKPIANQYDVHLYIDHYEQEIRVNGSGRILQVDSDGKRREVEFDTKGEEKIYHLPGFALILYKREEDLDKLLKHIHSKRKPTPERHREVGRLYGYGEKEIEEFIERFNEDVHST